MGFYDELPYRVENMRLEDVDEVMAIEARSFSSPWSARAYRYEVTTNMFSQYVIVRENRGPRADDLPPIEPDPPGLFAKLLQPMQPIVRPILPPVLGYAGFWLLIDEAHISTIAIAPEWRGRSLGELLLVALLDRAMTTTAEIATLEVRSSNVPAQSLYRKYLFQAVGLRRRYYTDNNEDALVLTTPPLRSSMFVEMLGNNKQALARSLREGAARPPADRAVTQLG